MYDLWVYQALVKAFAFLPWKTQFLHPFQGIWFNSVQKSRITQTGKEVQERTQSFHQNFKLMILLSLFAICNVGISAHASLLATSDVPILFSAPYLVSLNAPNGRTRFSLWEQIGIIPVMRHYMSQPRHLVSETRSKSVALSPYPLYQAQKIQESKRNTAVWCLTKWLPYHYPKEWENYNSLLASSMMPYNH